MDLIYREEAYKIIGACMEVYKDKGHGFVQLKAVKSLTDQHRTQVLNYLKATRMQLGLLVNFGHYPGLEWERIVLTNHS